MNIRHSSATNEYYSPPIIIEAARATLGAIDLDPASCEIANATIGAARFYNESIDGLTTHWSGRVFLNPPGGKVAGKSSQKVWWARLARAHAAGDVQAAIFVGFSLEILQTSQVGSNTLTPHAFPRCYPARRVAYMRPDGTTVDQPPHASVIVYLPYLSNPQRRAGLERFEKAFAPIGALGAGFCVEDWA